MHVTVNNAPIYCVEQGDPDSPPVVFIHGFPFSHEMWDGQASLLSPSFRVLRYDLRGHGLSFVGDGQYTVEGHVDDLLGLLDHWNAGRAVVVGLSMGGYIALRALERNPERFAAAVLCNTRSEADTNDAKLRRVKSMESVKRNGSAAFAEEFVRGVFAAGSFPRRPEAVAMIRSTIAHMSPLAIAGTQLALASRTDTTASLRNIRVPVLIFAGEADKTIPPSDSAAMQKNIPGAELHVVPGAAHLSNLENPEFFNSKLLDFLRRMYPSADR